MNARLLAYTQQNPALSRARAEGFSDLATIWEGKGTWAENVVEYAGRICYHSTHRMGTAPDFIVARVREGHEDIIEHIWATVEFSGDDTPARWRLLNRHCEISEAGTHRWVVSGNLRVWLDLFRQGVALEAQPLLLPIAPAVFGRSAFMEATPSLPDAPAPATDSSLLVPMQDGQMRVTLLGYTQPTVADAQLMEQHGAAVFLFEGISRTCTHQLVRHRLGSFSQESQRYVDLAKGAWTPIVPPPFGDQPAARAVLDDFWALAEEKYAQLRDLGVRKEDARFLLPNAAETRIVTSMNYAAWSHFFWLRAVDKAAQWEIRTMGQHALRMLHVVAPEVFAAHWRVYEERFAA